MQNHACKYWSSGRGVRIQLSFLTFFLENRTTLLYTQIRIDLTAASSIHIVEPQWNPMAEAQAIDRVHRIGQERDVEVVRYITSESIESVRYALR